MDVASIRLMMLIGSLVFNCFLLFLMIKLMDDRKDLRIQNKVLKTDNEHYRMALSGRKLYEA